VPEEEQMLQPGDATTLGCEENKHVVRRLYEEGFGQGRLELADQLVHPECRDLHASTPTGGRSRDDELHLWTLDGHGRIVRLRHYVDTAKHIAAATGNDTTSSA
jgi:hypothetical protein